ncbi:hypothetical protein R3X26_05765 [Vibrio sp. TH_r3]|uniref:hypothetical protein n=1 Tax=Vibrio sp. TH_r3 TaxID=3082084 RepID=UPI002952DD67|nr:hypothetical protein [Vibrio sp. TH_r3]MDV7103916.1 hypothetical protein [Vibrio sp. TH_r3]
MVENNDFQMAIDLLCCHLGLTEDQAKEQLGISDQSLVQKHVMNAQQSVLGLNSDK